MAEKPIKHPDGSLEISIKSFEQLKPRGDKVTWTIGTKFNSSAKMQKVEVL